MPYLPTLYKNFTDSINYSHNPPKQQLANQSIKGKQDKGKVFKFDLITDRNGDRQLWMDEKEYRNWKRSAQQLKDKQQEEFEFYTAVQEHLEHLGRNYQLWVEKYNIPIKCDTPNWYIDDSNEE